MSYNDLEMSSLVSTLVDEDPPRSEEVEVMSQNFDASTHHLNRPSTDGLKTPSSETLSNSERPKKAFIASKLSVIGHLAMYHLPATSITLALACLYSAHIRWGHLDNEQLNLLQFAAKGHETLILVSLTNILMHRIRYGLLLDGGGVPLGFLSASFNIGSPIQYFFSWELWAPLLRSRTKSKHTTSGSHVMRFAIVIAIILSVSIAPLSAIAIIPRAGLWQILKPRGLGNGTIYYFQKPQWETNFDMEANLQYQTSNDTVTEMLKTVLPVIKYPPITNNLSSTRQITNISFSKTDGLFVSLTMDLPQLSRTDTRSVTVATCPMDGVAETIDLPWDGEILDKDFLTTSQQKSLDNTSDSWDPENESTRADWWKKLHAAPTSRWKQPMVLVECADNYTFGDAFTFQFSTGISDNKVSLSGRYDDDFKTFLRDARHNKGVHPEVGRLVLDSSHSSGSPPSASILFLPTLDIEDERVEIALCRIYSRWVEANIWLEQGKPSVQSHLDAPLFDMEAHFGNTHSSGGPIKFSKDWLNSVSSESEDPTIPNDSYKAIVDFCSSLDPSFTPTPSSVNLLQCLSICLSVYFTHILSSMGPHRLYYEDEIYNSNDQHPTSENIIVHREYFIGGYGYSWHSSSTIPLAFSVLLLHVLIVIIHVVTVLWSRHPWYSSSWSSFGQMMILALRSKAPEDLGGVGAGVSSSATWNTSVSVRVVDPDDRLEMILQEEKGVVSQDQELDSRVEEAGRNTRLSFARPGVKYH
ncbi:hypothetical protein NW768_006009 [Fusarium equiseti]|uniref:Uncharacterized protein n=1 Tax=Fusarium equiseti TaxID=61235 RepID=A0ABQ8RDH2_FUSEQ|nr:hypothetical protein NW768_006009 [Fusarium equiseti]